MALRSQTALTSAQQVELRRLMAAGAMDAEAALSVYDLGMKHANPNVIGILIDKGLALKRVRTRKRVSRTIYWLTEAGQAQARAVAA